MEPTKELIDELYREQVRDARRQTVAERFLSALSLFDLACQWAKAGIRLQHPDANEDQVSEILKERLELGRRLEDRA